MSKRNPLTQPPPMPQGIALIPTFVRLQIIQSTQVTSQNPMATSEAETLNTALRQPLDSLCVPVKKTRSGWLIKPPERLKD